MATEPGRKGESLMIGPVPFITECGTVSGLGRPWIFQMVSRRRLTVGDACVGDFVTSAYARGVEGESTSSLGREFLGNLRLEVKCTGQILGVGLVLTILSITGAN